MLLKRTILFSIIIITLMNISKANIYASSGLNKDTRNIVNVAVLLYTFDDLFMQQLKQDLEDIQNKNKDNVRFTFYDGKNNITVQNETLSSIATQGNTDLIMANLADISENAISTAIDIIKPKEIPIVFLDVSPDVVAKVSSNYEKDAFILANSDLAGTVQGNILINLWKTNKKTLDKNDNNILEYVLLQGEADNPVAIDRSNYSISTINNSGIKTDQLAHINANWLKELSKNAIDSLFLRYNNRIEAIIANNDAMALGAIEALQKYGYNKGDKSKYIAVVGIDAIPEAKNLVDQGLMTGTVVQDSKILAEVFYNVGMNLVQNLNPIENTNYKIVNEEIIIPFPYKKYVSE